MADIYKSERSSFIRIDIPGVGGVSVEVEAQYPTTVDEYVDGGAAMEWKLPSGETLATHDPLTKNNTKNGDFLNISQDDSVWNAITDSIKGKYPSASNITSDSVKSNFLNSNGGGNFGKNQLIKSTNDQRNKQLTNNPESFNRLISNAELGATQTEQLKLEKPDTPNPFSGLEGSAVDPIAFTEDTPSRQFSGGGGGGGLFYPTELANLKEDYIKFVSKRYVPDDLSQSGPAQDITAPGAPEATIYLPVSGGAADANTVSWGPNQMNEIQKQFYTEGYNIITNKTNVVQNAVETSLNSLRNKVQQNLMNNGESIAKAAGVYFASQAVGVGNMLSRSSGAIFNPNMLLLFNNPELRKFTFNYKFTPRDQTEADSVRKIIRVFKQTSAPRKAQQNLFLLAPNVFEISYHLGGSSTHKGMGRIKVCALTGVAVNYVPDGSYMTFEDGTMTSYQMTLSFSEVTPVYYDDYEEIGIPDDEIGF